MNAQHMPLDAGEIKAGVAVSNDAGDGKRWIRISVGLIDHDDLDDGAPYDRRSAWLWLIANAAWKNHSFHDKSRKRRVTLQRGQVLAGREYLAEQWRWSEKKVRNFIALLTKRGMIEPTNTQTEKKGQAKGRFASIVTICKYETYQTAAPDEGQAKGQAGAKPGPSRGQTVNKNTNGTSRDSPPTPPLGGNGHSFWAEALNPGALGDIQFVDGRLTLVNGTHARWLDEFGGDEKRLKLALSEIEINPNSRTPVAAQVEKKLARIARQSHEAKQNYIARTTKAPSAAQLSDLAEAEREAAEAWERTRKINEELEQARLQRRRPHAEPRSAAG